MNQKASPVDQYPRVSFRLGALLTEIEARGDSPNRVARRDLERYYDLLRKVLPPFEENEGVALLQALETWTPTRGGIRGRPGARARRARGRPGARGAGPGALDLAWAVSRTTAGRIGERGAAGRPAPRRIDSNDLASRLRDLHPSESLAVVDALEQALHLMSSARISEADALRQVGLLTRFGAQRGGRRGRSGGRSGSER